MPAGSFWIFGIFSLERRECEEKAVALAATPVRHFSILKCSEVKVKLVPCLCCEEQGYAVMGLVLKAPSIVS